MKLHTYILVWVRVRDGFFDYISHYQLTRIVDPLRWDRSCKPQDVPVEQNRIIHEDLGGLGKLDPEILVKVAKLLPYFDYPVEQAAG